MSSLPPAQLPETWALAKAAPADAKLHLYTVGTPNGYKPSILLEELARAYPGNKELVYDFHALRFAETDQKKPGFLEINPNGRIPALVDDNVKVGGEGHKVFESASILLWLVERYDKEYKFSFEDPVERSRVLSWIFFAHGGVGPMQGQANHFFRYAPEKIPYGIKRYQEETARLYSVLEGQLAKKESGGWLVGGRYSIADINGKSILLLAAVFPWVRVHAWAGVDIEPFPAVAKWLEAIEARPGVYAGLGVPTRSAVKRTKEEEEKLAEEAKKWIHKKD
ncbi:glutathione S-transferase [Cryptococcus wingfieldii CBS 7118]|uniref:Glutathione S-transferase n=1 Tax=Cryptococcus wingfieldii CBS 7118 TaxID=1295528 RepID=A0A1E3I1V4_9TREE|nr:glutathione S-transferase [Cryptococcus wingfieldii CBS 7118]ODN82488.1 glutathione S-transferase [Cryptococcus wingfieldii CBS 7118]